MVVAFLLAQLILWVGSPHNASETGPFLISKIVDKIYDLSG